MTEHLISRPAQAAPCRRCGHLVLTAIAGGLNVTADPKPLSVDAEIAAVLMGRQTYDIQATESLGAYLEWRHLDRIRAERIYPVVATHVCKSPITPVPLAAVEPVPVSLPDEPPF